MCRLCPLGTRSPVLETRTIAGLEQFLTLCGREDSGGSLVSQTAAQSPCVPRKVTPHGQSQLTMPRPLLLSTPVLSAAPYFSSRATNAPMTHTGTLTSRPSLAPRPVVSGSALLRFRTRHKRHLVFEGQRLSHPLPPCSWAMVSVSLPFAVTAFARWSLARRSKRGPGPRSRDQAAGFPPNTECGRRDRCRGDRRAL